MDEPFSIPRMLKCHITKSDKIIEGDPLKYKGKVIETMYPYIIPIVHETKMNYIFIFNPYTDEVKNNIHDGLKKNLQRVTILISNVDSDDDGNLGSNPIGVCIGDDVYLTTSKVIVVTSINGDFHKCAAMLEEAVLYIASYIKEKRLNKKEKNEQQHEKKRNKEEENMSKMDELATVVAEEKKKKKIRMNKKKKKKKKT
ncbi:hypothetical protein FXO38_35077 [Capsicum annuum]|nr:hypothetical protein FXO38_35077 [Capsicum annuum]